MEQFHLQHSFESINHINFQHLTINLTVQGHRLHEIAILGLRNLPSLSDLLIKILFSKDMQSRFPVINASTALQQASFAQYPVKH